LSGFRDCIFNIFAATFHIGGRSAIRNLRTRHAVVTVAHTRHAIVTVAHTRHAVVTVAHTRRAVMTVGH